VRSKRTGCSRRSAFSKSFGDVCLDPGSVCVKWEEGFFFLEAPKQGRGVGTGIRREFGAAAV